MRALKFISLLGVAVSLSATANAQFSVSGGGSAVPASGSGGDGGALYPTTMPATPGASTATVPGNVTSITSIEVDGFAHTWSGDVQCTLADPNGVEHLIFLRPGFLNTSNFGSAGDFGGDYTFVESGGSSLPTTSAAGSNIPAGTYNQSFSSGGATWVSGDNGINNTPMSAITGPQGDWTLTMYDWGGGDSGAFTGWTLNGDSDGNECFLTIGDSAGSSSFTPDQHTLTSQLNGVNTYYPVLLDSMPEFIIPGNPGTSISGNGTFGNASVVRSAFRTFAVEVIMYNETVFPTQPEQHSNGLLVYISNSGNVTTVPFGTGTMGVWANVAQNSSGQKVLTFPFTMPQ
ncbi:MAG: hypothetical protein ACI8X5_000621 [Planctomycetota bacterium]|jgi:hypothetical protein